MDAVTVNVRLAELSIRRQAMENQCGRRVCCVCKQDLGPCPGLPKGQLSHTFCNACGEAELKKIRASKTGDENENVDASSKPIM